MKKVLAQGVCFTAGAELFTLAAHDRRMVLWVSGVVTAVTLSGLRKLLGNDSEPAAAATGSEAEHALRRWLSNTERLLHWSETTRADWDQHWRPTLARRFEDATGLRQRADPAMYAATGRMLLGSELWAWVDPANLVAGSGEPGPGRATLDEILQRLERA